MKVYYDDAFNDINSAKIIILLTGYQNSLSKVFHFRSVKFHFVKETHMMVVAFWRWWKLLQHLSTTDNETDLCQDLLTIKNTELGLKSARFALYKYNGLLVRVRLPFQKLLQTRKTSRNNKKLTN